MANRREALKRIAAGTAGAVLLADSALGDQPPVEITATPVTPHTVRITIHPVENGQPLPVPVDGALIERDWPAPVTRWRPGDVARQVRCGDLSIDFAPDPLTVRIQEQSGRPVQELRLDPVTGIVHFQLGDTPVLGLGQGGAQLDRRGHTDLMHNGQAGYKLATHGARVPIQFLIGTSGWALFIHQPLGHFDLTGADGVFQPASPVAALPADLFITGGVSAPEDFLREYAVVTGFAEMPPLWSFGYQQSHRTLGTQEDTLAEARTFRDKKLPCDAMIYLGSGFCPNGWNTNNGEFAWNANAFSNPKAAIDHLHSQNFKVVLHIVVEGRHFTGTVHDPCTNPTQPPGRTPDGRWPDNREVSCYWPAHKPLVEIGVDGWWPDQGDGLDAPSRLARNRMYFEGQQMYRPNRRVYALHRNGYAGMQRYASFLWSGDVQSTWETLKTHVSVGLNAGLSGIPFWGTDIGGFVPTAEYTGELYARWFQFGAFCPLFRSHGRVWTLHLPWGWDMGFPPAYVSAETPSYHPSATELHNATVEPICRKYLELRYRLMPYLYSAVKETCDTGVPIFRALWLHYPDDPVAVARGDEYLFGRDILVAPVVEKGATERSLYLPKGDWYDFWTQEPVAGGRELTRKVDLATTPLYVRAGAVLPLGPIKQNTAEKNDNPVDLWVYPRADGAFSLYEDDGETFNYHKGEFTRIDFLWNDKSRRLAAGSKTQYPGPRRFNVHVAGESISRELVFHGRTVEMQL